MDVFGHKNLNPKSYCTFSSSNELKIVFTIVVAAEKQFTRKPPSSLLLNTLNAQVQLLRVRHYISGSSEQRVLDGR